MNSDNQFFFVHIEKTAGTTLHQLLKENFSSYLAIHPVYLKGAQRRDYLLDTAQAERLLSIRRAAGLGGHPVRSHLGYEKSERINPIYFTFLRDPLQRYFSMYSFVNQNFGLSRSLDEYLDMPINSNWQCQRICGERDGTKAIEELKRYRFVGLVESFNESLVYLNKYVFNWNLRLRFFSKRVAQTGDWRDGISDAHMERAIENNRMDIELYQFAKEQLYANYNADYEPELPGPFIEASAAGKGLTLIKGFDRYVSEPLSYYLRSKS
jgi:hypothetical protein